MVLAMVFQPPTALFLSHRVCAITAAGSFRSHFATSTFAFSKEYTGVQCCCNQRILPSQKLSFLLCSSSAAPRSCQEFRNKITRALQTWTLTMVAIATPLLPFPPSIALEGPIEPTALVAAPTPTKDVDTLLRDALPIQNETIREVQKSLEGITDCLKLPPEVSICDIVFNTRRAGLVLDQYKDRILAEVVEPKKVLGQLLVDELSTGITDLNKVIEENNINGVSTKQRELLQIISKLEEIMVKKFPYDVPEEYANKPLLKGRATIEMKVRLKDRPTGNGNSNGNGIGNGNGNGNGNGSGNGKSTTIKIVVDGYNAPVTAGNFVDLVERRFYDGMAIQKADGFIVQTGDPPGAADGFVDPGTGKVRTIPLEIMVEGDKAPIYGATLEDLGREQDQTKLPFNSCSTLAMARKDKDKNSASSQIFWLLKDCQEKKSELKETEEVKEGLTSPEAPLKENIVKGSPLDSPAVTERVSSKAQSEANNVKESASNALDLKVKDGTEGSASIELNSTDPNVDDKKETVTKEINPIVDSIVDGVATDGNIGETETSKISAEAPIPTPTPTPTLKVMAGQEGEVHEGELSKEPELQEGGLKESEIMVNDLKRSNGTTKDGRYAVFGYVVENQDLLGKLKVGDVIESMRVVSGIENLVNPSYRI